MNIGIDARPLISQKAGVGYYLEGLMKNILKNDIKNNYYLFSDREIYFDINDYKNVIKVEDINKIVKKTFWYYTKLPILLKRYNINLFWGTQHVIPQVNKDCKTVLTIHDLVCYEYPKTMSLYNKIINKLFIPYSIKNADKIVAVSKSTKNGILKYFSDYINENKINVIYEDSNININEIPDKLKENNLLRRNNLKKNNYLLFIGTIEPRKNIKVLIDAFEMIRKEINIKLVLCGKIGWKYNSILKKITNSPERDNILYLNYISNEDKIILIRNCFAFIFPSLYEGFGIPVLETIKLGSIALVSKTSSLDEIITKDELKFDKNKCNEIFSKVINLYKDKELYNDCKNYCINQASYFSWDDISRQYIKLFNNMLNKN